jgi:hypothetical protein
VLAAILVVHAAIVFFAWQASSTFRSAVREAREEMSKEKPDAPTQVAQAAAQPAIEPVHEPERDERPATETQLLPALDEWISQALAPHDISFRIAERDIEEGEFAAARRLLYSLLATQDRLGLPAERVADAQYFIAKAWAHEASRSGAEPSSTSAEPASLSAKPKQGGGK